MVANGFPGRRVEPYRAGIIATTAIRCASKVRNPRKKGSRRQNKKPQWPSAKAHHGL
jgi:hypothetical protein